MRGSRKITSLARALAPFANRTAGSVVDRIISAAAGAGTFVDANTIHLSGAVILLRHPGAARLAEYPATTEGLAAALAAAVAGDTVLLPGGTISLPVAAGGTYVPGAEIATGSIDVKSEAGHEISGLEIGQWYAVESWNGYFSVGSFYPQESSKFQLSDGSGFSGLVGQRTEGVYGETPPDFCAHAEVFTGTDGKVYGRAYFQAATTSIWVRVQDDPGSFGDNYGTLSWRLRAATIEHESTLLVIPAGVEVVGLGRNSILDGDLIVNGVLTNCAITGEVTGSGKLRLVYIDGREVITDLSLPEHEHPEYAPVDHTHLLNDLADVDTSSAVTGDILTYDRLEAPLSAAAKATIIATASHGAATLSNALDGVEDTLQYYSGTNQVAGMFVQFDFGAPVTLTEIEMVCLYGENIHSDYPSAWKISASDTGSFSGEETVVYVGSATMMGRLACPFDAPHEARYWRITLTAKKSNWWRVNEFNFVEVSEMGWSSKPLPDHDHTAGDIDSTGASDGQVLTADGLGGAAWETPAGGSVAASAVTVDASGFAGNLSAADTDVQTALETLDAMTVSGGGGGSAPGYAETIGDGVETSYTITHELGTTDVIVQVYDLDASPNPALVDATVEIVDEDTVLVAFDSPPSTDQYRVVVVAVAEGAGGGTEGGDLTRIGFWVHTEDVEYIDFPITADHRAQFSALRIVAHVRSDYTGSEIDGLRIRFSTGGVLDTGNTYSRRCEDTGNQSNTENTLSGDSIWIGRYVFPAAQAAAGYFGLGDCLITGWNKSGTVTVCHGMAHCYTEGINYRFSKFMGMWKNTGEVDGIRVFLDRSDRKFVAGSWIAIYGMK